MKRYTLEVYFAADPGPLTPEAIAYAASERGVMAFKTTDEAESIDPTGNDRAWLAAEYFKSEATR